MAGITDSYKVKYWLNKFGIWLVEVIWDFVVMWWEWNWKCVCVCVDSFLINESSLQNPKWSEFPISLYM